MVDYVIPANDDAVRSVKLLIGVLTNAIAEANGNEVIDFVSEDDKAKTEKRAQKKEADKTSEVKEEKAEEKVTEDLSALTLSELKDRAKDAGVKGYSAMKKQDLVEALTK